MTDAQELSKNGQIVCSWALSLLPVGCVLAVGCWLLAVGCWLCPRRGLDRGGGVAVGRGVIGGAGRVRGRVGLVGQAGQGRQAG